MRVGLLILLIGFHAAYATADEPAERTELLRQQIILWNAQAPYFRTHCSCGNKDAQDFVALAEAQRQLTTVTDLAASETASRVFGKHEFRLYLFLAVQDSAMSDATKLAFARRAALLGEERLPLRAVLPVAYTLHELGARQDLPLLVNLARRQREVVAGLALESCARLGGAPDDLLLFDEAAELRARLTAADRDARESLARRVREFTDSGNDSPPSPAN